MRHTYERNGKKVVTTQRRPPRDLRKPGEKPQERKRPEYADAVMSDGRSTKPG